MMVTTKLHIDPVTRLEGHYSVKLDVEDGHVVDAHGSGGMFRGFEILLRGRNPLDAQQITQRICGVCPISHGIASVLAQEDAYKLRPPKNGRLVRNLILAGNYLHSHLIHFYQLSSLDFVDITSVLEYQGKDPALQELKSWVQSEISAELTYPAAPFLPRYSGDYIEDLDINLGAIKHYLEALEMRALAHKMAAIFCGKIPHACTIVPGGVTEKISIRSIAAYREMLKRIQTFIDYSYLPDVTAVAAAYPQYFQYGKGCGNFLTYGVFAEGERGEKLLFPSGVYNKAGLQQLNSEKITEHVRHSWFKSPSGLNPRQGRTDPDPQKEGAYSWLKSPRYDGQVHEVGPLSRIMIAYLGGTRPLVNKLVDDLLQTLGRRPEDLVSVLGRHAARALECKIIADRSVEWLEQLEPGAPAFQDFDIPDTGRGMGLTEAPRGALGHWLEIEGGYISHYQCIVPTTWNCSPRDDEGVRGPVEQALVGMPISDIDNPIEAVRVVRSFDPCVACAVH